MSLTVDLHRILRRRKPERRLKPLATRPVSRLAAATDLTGPGRSMLVPDTNVYIKSAAGILPPAVAALLDRALLFHCTVCLGELALGVAHADPTHPRWPAIRGHYAGLFASIPATRLLTPDAETWAEAGVIAGTLARSQGFQRHQRKECLNDALILLTAAKAGLPVLTANRGEFDLIQQLAPEGRFFHF
jgi:predicted nucleic acid-binding protein